MKCEHCPISKSCPDQLCIVEKFGATNLCKKVDPSSPDYNKNYETIISDKSCGTNNYASMAVPRECSDEEPPKKEFPSTWQQLKNFARTGAAYVKDGMKNVSQEEYDERMSICNSCDQLDKKTGRCAGCGCKMSVKSWLRVAQCPLNKWPSVTGISDKNGDPVS